MGDLFPGVRTLIPSAHPELARAWSASLGPGRAVVVEEGARVVERRVSGRDAASDIFKLILQSRGAAQLSHSGRSARMAPGDLVLVDGARPFHLELGLNYRQVVLELPRGLVARRCGNLLGQAGSTLSGERPVHALVFHALEAMVSNMAGLARDERARMLEPVLALLGLLQVAPASASEAERRVVRALADLEGNLGDAELSAATLAGWQGISRRRLDAVFATRGLSVERLIWDKRLERAASDLENPAHRERRLIDIALSWGFNSPSHFSTAFRRKYGQNPSAYRRAKSLGSE